jgi:hypothetical protein
MSGRTRHNVSTAFQTHYEYDRYGFADRPEFIRTGDFLVTSDSVIVDGTHPGWETSTGDVGGPLYLYSDVWEFSPAVVSVTESPWHFYRGAFVPMQMEAGSGGEDLSFPIASDYDMIRDGASCITRTTPTRPLVNFSNDMGETLEGGLPAVVGLETMKSRTKFLMSQQAKGVKFQPSHEVRGLGSKMRTKKPASKLSGSEYLNVEFGWLPLLSDVDKLVKAVKSSNKLITQYLHGSRQKIRRRYSLPDDVADGAFSGNAFASPDLFGVFGHGEGSSHASKRNWFSGAFEYYVPVGDDFGSRMRRWVSEANRLSGSSLTPSVLWELAPWSWAVDWFANVGDVMANISALGSDGLVLQYGYVMSENISQTTIAASFTCPLNGEEYPCSSTHTIKCAKRLGATPYGFGFDLSSLSAKQEAVIVALGLSKSHR